MSENTIVEVFQENLRYLKSEKEKKTKFEHVLEKTDATILVSYLN